MKLVKRIRLQIEIRQLAFAMVLCAACSLFSPRVQAQTTYYWTNSMGGSWSTAANWLNGSVATGSGNIADFSTYVGLTNNTIVSVNTPVTIGSMIIGNSNVVYGGQSTNNWIFTDGGSTANTITLSGGSSTITVTNMGTGSNVVDFSTATISGTSGLTVNGGSSLELDVTNYYTGGTTIAGGTLIIGTGSTAGESMNATEIYTLGSSTVTAASILRVFRNSVALANPIVCAPNAAGPLMIGEWNGNTLQITDPYMNLNGDTLIFTNGADNSTHNFVIETSGSTTAGITNYGNITLINNSPSGDYFSFGAGTPGDVLNCIGSVTLEGTATSTASKVSQYYYGPAVTNINIIGPCPISAFNAPTNTSGDFTINSTTTNTIGAITLPAGLSNATFNVNNSAPIKVGTVAAGFQGNIVNSGAGPGALLITGAITTGTSNVVQSSTGSSLVLSAANTYSGATIINAGSLVLTNTGSIADTTNISIAAAATFDVSALSANTFTAGSSSSLSASGTGTTVGTSAAAINGKSGGTVSLGSIPITLNFDGADPALYISQGTLSLDGNAFTVNSSSPLAVGTYTIIQQASGNITSSGTYPVSGTAIGAGYSGTISVSGGTASLTVGTAFPPGITSVSPASGTTNGDTLVTLTGSNFVSGATVEFGSLAGSSVAVISSTTITVTTPAQAAGTVSVIVENPNTQTATNSYTYIAGPGAAGNSGVWTGAASDGLWSDAGNWVGGVIADGSGNTADFSRLALVANATVHVNYALTIGNLIIANTNTILTPSATYTWTFDNSGNAANILTLAPATSTFTGGGSAITVTNMGAGLVDFSTAVFGGTNGLVINGGGVLEIDNPCPYTNGTAIAGATLVLGTNALAGEENAGTNDVYTLGSSTATASSILRPYMNYANFSNPINCAPGAAGPLIIGEWNGKPCNIVGNPYINLNGDTLICTNGADNTPYNFVVEPTAGITNYGNLILVNNSPGTNYFAFGANGLPVPNIVDNIGTVTMEGTATVLYQKQFQVFYGPAVTNINILGPCAIPGFIAPSNTSGNFTITSSSTNGVGTITLPVGLSNVMFNANSGFGFTNVAVVSGFSGPVVNSGTGAGATVVSGAIPGTANVVQKSSTSPLILLGANTYSGGTVVSAGALILTNSASIADTTNISVAAGATLDVSGLAASTFALGSPTALSASGTGTTVGTSAASINGQSGGTINLGSIPIALNFDGSDPALYIPQGTLSLGGNAFTVNSSSPLAPNTYTIAEQASGTITSTGSYPAVTGTAIGAGTTGAISVSGGIVSLVVSSGGGSPPPATISSVMHSGGNLILVWQGGTNQSCVLLTTTNVGLPVADWTPVTTNTVGSNGLSTNTLPISPSQPHQFFLLDIP